MVLARRTVRQGAGAIRSGSFASDPVTSTLATPPKKSVTSVSAGEMGESSVDTPGCDLIRAGSYVLNCSHVYQFNGSMTLFRLCQLTKS